MLHFKQEGFRTYDWGGVNLDSTSIAYSITEFKVGFGGHPRAFYNYYCDFSLNTNSPQKLIRKIRNKFVSFLRLLLKK